MVFTNGDLYGRVCVQACVCLFVYFFLPPCWLFSSSRHFKQLPNVLCQKHSSHEECGKWLWQKYIALYGQEIWIWHEKDAQSQQKQTAFWTLKPTKETETCPVSFNVKEWIFEWLTKIKLLQYKSLWSIRCSFQLTFMSGTMAQQGCVRKGVQICAKPPVGTPERHRKVNNNTIREKNRQKFIHWSPLIMGFTF